MASLIAIYDACVLYPAPLRDFLMQLALTDLFRAKWTDRIHDEWIRNVLKNRPDLKKEQLEKTRELMNKSTRDALVENYDTLIESIQLPDPDDRHVMAAAIHAKPTSSSLSISRIFPQKYYVPIRWRPFLQMILSPG